MNGEGDPPDRARRGERGFTLIELAIVVLIIAIVTRFALPQLRSLTAAELGASTRRLANVTHYLYEEAALRGVVYTLYFDLDRQEYWVEHADEGSAQPIEDEDLLGRRVRMPPDVRLADVVVPGVGKISSGLVPTRFYPEGYADRSVVHLVDSRGHQYTVRIDPVRGRGEVLEGYQDFEIGS
jgi:prepilin-type N-terminal cleavage/methylation domain-containing protein